MNRQTCPPVHDLSAYTVGRLAPATGKAVETHLEFCTSCLAALDTLPVPADPLAAAFAEPVAVANAPRGRAYWQGLEKVRRLGRKLVPAKVPSTAVDSTDLHEPTQLGPYRLIERIGEGGMGTVWLAEQTEPVKRTVAVKLIKPGLDTAQILARFDAERQALALMDHPNIAKVLDAGAVGSEQWAVGSEQWAVGSEERRQTAEAASPLSPLAGKGFGDEGPGRSPLPIGHCQLPTAVRSGVGGEGPDCSPLPTGHCPLPTAVRSGAGGEGPDCSPLPTGHCPLPTAGRPFFVMELVNGMPITKFCDQQRLTVRQRLELFIPVCQAVQHAHQKGVIHRDLKPSNVLIALYDGKPVPKVIDFGVSKAARPRLSEHSAVTGFGDIVGTFEYMSPEQAEFNAVDIDTRSDIFSLGVLLYELLAGTTPLTRQRLKAAGPVEALRLIRDEEPPRPSARLKEAGTILPLVAEQRGTEPRRLTRLLHGDLDWLVLKALEKDRNRRYETANAMALDIERYLHDEPILASPPGAGYRLRKYVRRNKGPLLTAALVLLALVGGMVGTALGLVEAWRLRDAAELAQHHAELAQQNEASQRRAAELAQKNEEIQRRAAETDRNRAVLAEAEAKASAAAALAKEQQARQAEKDARELWEFFRFRVVEGAAQLPTRGGLGNDASIATALHHAEPAITSTFHDQPLVEATLRDTLGIFYLRAGKAKLAIEQHQQAAKIRQEKLGPDHSETAGTRNNLALALHSAGRVPEAIKLHEELLELRKTTLGPDALKTLITMQNLATACMDAGRADDALLLYQRILELRKNKLGPEHVDTLDSASVLAHAYEYLNRPAEALPLRESNLKLGKATLPAGHTPILGYMFDLANVYLQLKRPNDALPLAQELVTHYEKTYGPTHDDIVGSMCLKGIAQWQTGRQKEALATFEEAVARSKRILGADHLKTLRSMGNLANAYFQLRMYKDAVPLYEVLLKQIKEHQDPDGISNSFVNSLLGCNYPDLLTTMSNLTDAYHMSGRVADAVPLGQEALEVARSTLGPKHLATLVRMNNLARAYQDVGRMQDALVLAAQAVALHKEAIGADHLATFDAMGTLASIYFALDRFQDAAPVLTECVQGTRKQVGVDHPATQIRMSNLAECLEHLQAEKAEPIRRELVEVAKAKNGPASLQFAERQLLLGRNLALQRKFSDAEPILRDGLRLSQKLRPAAWANFLTMSWLGASLAGQKHFADAEPLLVEGYEGLKQHANEIPVRSRTTFVSDALQRLVDLYEAWDRPEQAERWRKELAAVKQKK